MKDSRMIHGRTRSVTPVSTFSGLTRDERTASSGASIRDGKGIMTTSFSVRDSPRRRVLVSNIPGLGLPRVEDRSDPEGKGDVSPSRSEDGQPTALVPTVYLPLKDKNLTDRRFDGFHALTPGRDRSTPDSLWETPTFDMTVWTKVGFKTVVTT